MKDAIASVACPACRGTFELGIPTDRCLAFASCPSCGKMLKPKRGSCCVICSYSDARCPCSTKK